MASELKKKLPCLDNVVIYLRPGKLESNKDSACIMLG